MMHGQKNIKLLQMLCLATLPPPPPENRAFMRKCGKILYSQTGHRLQYNTVHEFCVLDT